MSGRQLEKQAKAEMVFKLEDQARAERLRVRDGRLANAKTYSVGDVEDELGFEDQVKAKMPTDEDGRLLKEEQLEKKPQGEGCRFEEEPKRLKVEDEDEDPDFREGDSDDDENKERKGLAIESGVRDLYDEPPSQDDSEGRICDKVPLCELYQHRSTCFHLPIFDIFKVKLILDENRTKSLSGPLYGSIEIAESPENPGPISYYYVKKDNAVPITLTPGNSIILPLSGPITRPPIASCYEFVVDFTFNFDNKYLFEDGCSDGDGDPNHSAKFGDAKNLGHICVPPNSIKGSYRCCVARYVVGYSDGYSYSDDIKVAAYCGIYRGVWATVDVKIFKNGVSSFYGFIYARSCILKSRIRLLSIQADQKRKLGTSESEHQVELTRKFVSVPTHSSLIIVAVLYDQDDMVIVRDKTFFPASQYGAVGKFMGKRGVGITVNWVGTSFCEEV